MGSKGNFRTHYEQNRFCEQLVPLVPLALFNEILAYRHPRNAILFTFDPREGVAEIHSHVISSN